MFSRRVVPLLAERAQEFDVVHDNQTFGSALLRLPAAGLPLVGTIHHPVAVDRVLELQAASWRRQIPVRRWYGFTRMQGEVARQIPLSIAPSRSSADDAVRDFRVAPGQMRIVPIGVDAEQFRPRGPRVAGRIVALCSADVPLKGLEFLLRAMAQLPGSVDATLTVVSKPTPGGSTEKLVANLGLAHRVDFVSGLAEDAVAELMASAEVAVVPSLYEGFSLPAVEAMASGTPLIASDTSALPEVVGRDGTCGLLVPPGDVAALSAAIQELMAAPDRRAAMGLAARAHAVERFSWAATAAATAEVYRESIVLHRRGIAC